MIIEIFIGILSGYLGLDKSLYKKLITLKKRDEREVDISKNFEIIQDKLNESQTIISNVLTEVAEQKKIFDQKANEAKISENIIKLNQSEVDSIKSLFERSIHKEGKKLSTVNIIWGFIFCILSAVIGFILGKIIN